MPKQKLAPKKSVSSYGGPYLAAAVFCDRILEDKDKSLSAIRIVDTCVVEIPAHAPVGTPSAESPVAITQQVLIAFKSGGNPGLHTMTINVVDPNGTSTKVLEKELEFSPEIHGGMNIRIPATILIKGAGIYSLDVFLDKKLFTRMPINIDVKQLKAPEPASAEVKPKKSSTKNNAKKRASL